MKKTITIILFVTIWVLSLNFTQTGAPVISNLSYNNITQTSVTINWTTDLPADSKIKWMAPDSNYQPLVFTDSVYNSSLITNHSIILTNLQPAKIYKFMVFSQNSGGAVADSGYFVTRSNSTGKINVYFNHSIDSTVSSGEKANGVANFTNLLIHRIDSALHSIDITLWEFNDITEVAVALVKAKNRGVKIRFIYTSNNGTSPLIDSLTLHNIPVLRRNYDSANSMHNKFWIFDYRFNTNTDNKYLWTGSTNVTHPQFHSDRNNIIIIQDEALCAVYTREFEEMWGSHTNAPNKIKARFGAIKADNVPHLLNINGKRVEAYFSPSDSIERHITNVMMTNTTQSLFFCMLKFSLKNIEDTLHNLFNIGMEVKGVFDSANSASSSSVFRRMKGEPVPNAWNPHANVFIDTIPGLIHHKYFVTDANSSSGNKVTGTGSFNWEPNASFRNDENILIIYDDLINNLYFQEFYARYRESGGEVILGINNQNEINTTKYPKLEQNRPNPFTTKTNIPYQLQKDSYIEIKIYNFMGTIVKTITTEYQKQGFYSVDFDASGFPAGIYYYRLSTENFSEAKKMIVVN